MIRPTTLITTLLALTLLPAAHAQQDPRALVASAVQSELHANHTDHTPFIYRDHDITPEHNTLFFTVETPLGNLRRQLEDHGKPLTPEQRKTDDERIHALMTDKNLQQKQQRDNAHDDQQAEEMLKLLPTAFLWTLVSEKGDLITLDFKPDPAFQPTSMESRVLSTMAGQIVIARGDNRIRTIRGVLVDDVKFFLGIGGRLKKGGGFQVERREVAPHHWQVVETHTKIEGKALFFKSIGSIEDEVRTDFHISPAQNLEQAHEIIQKDTPN